MREASETEPLPVRQARQGDPDAWETLLRRYRLPVYAYVFELVHDEQAALDIAQEAFINAARHIDGLREDGKFGSWLFNIAHQKAAQHWRRRRPEAEPLEPDDEELASGDPGPEEQLIRAEQEAGVMKALEELPGPHRAVLLLHVLEEFSLEEIAQITGAPTGTVKSRLHYARKALRKLLEEKAG